LPPIIDARYDLIVKNIALCYNNHYNINKFIKKLPSKYSNVGVIDINSEIGTPEGRFKPQYPSPDGLHPGNNARRYIRKVVYSEIIKEQNLVINN
jgi:hypothetical protein